MIWRFLKHYAPNFKSFNQGTNFQILSIYQIFYKEMKQEKGYDKNSN